MSFRPERFAEILAERGLGLGHPTTFRPVTSSTNDDALEGARQGAPHGSLYVADAQTAGRGRRGNRWFGTPGQSIAFTVLLRPKIAAARASGLALVGGLAVRAAVESWLRASMSSTGSLGPALVKWPNDVVVGGRKLCGILAESQMRSTEVLAVALGVGLNLGTNDMPAELAETATSLRALGVPHLSMEASIVDVLGELEPRLRAFLAGGESTVEELRLHDALFGRRVRVGRVEGVAAGINRSGSLLLQNAEGAVNEVLSGHIELVTD